MCGGAIQRRTNVATRIGYEDPSQPFLHVNDDDWKDDPHDAEEYVETKSGKKLYFDDIEALAAEAEEGYDITRLLESIEQADAGRVQPRPESSRSKQ